MDYVAYYASITKPFFAPPEWMFGLAWGVIYPLIAVAFLHLLYLAYKKRASGALVFWFIINLVANLAFTPILFDLQSIPLATVDILIVLGTLAYLEKRFWREAPVIFWLLVPYLLWGTFATVLQVTILFLN